ncbi:MAG: tetratricopeptide repeat protein [Candidatus Poribacteria bacterium]|nr:tetratricopeptide repeat protein [Candidatus Poribacteria bacterium]
MKHRHNFLWTFPRVAIIVFLLVYTINPAPAQTTLPAEDIAEKALAVTVYLEMQDKNGKTLGIGSGFFVKSNLIATNYHVIEGAAKGTAKLVGKNTTYNIEGVTATDKTNDLVLLKVTAYGTKPLSLGDSDKVRIGETVYVAGNPKGLEGTFSDGIISSRRDKLTKERLQMTAPISPGSSGGPVLNRKGEVIGVSFAVYKSLDAQNLNFAIPSTYLQKLLEKSKQAERFPPTISAETYFRWGNAKYKTGDYEGAISDYTTAIRLKSDYIVAYNNRGMAKGLLKRYSDAIEDFDTVIGLQPDYAEAYVARGLMKDQSGQHFAAITDYDTAIRLQPNLAAAYHARGNVKSKLKQYSAAIADYDIAIKLKPSDADTYLRRGIAKHQLEQYSAAITDYDTAIRLQPNLAAAYHARGNVKSKLKQYSAAITDYDTAIRLQPNLAEVYYNRGVSKTFLGQILEGKQDLHTALRLAIKASDANLKTKVEDTLRILNE